MDIQYVPLCAGWVLYMLKVGACNLYVSGSACKFLVHVL